MSAVAIFGPGLIGGSLALALNDRRPADTVRIWTRSPASAARTQKFFPEVFLDPVETAEGADLCVFCTPIGAMADLARLLAPHLPRQTVVTDAGSVKGPVVSELETILGGRFLGSHPMAGSEKNGIEAARADLFDGATCILTPTDRTHADARKTVEELWKSVGGRLVEMTPSAHDEAVATVSHLPHAMASILVNTVAACQGDAVSLAGGGYRDSTRIAAGPPAMWAEIFLQNQTALLAGLEEFSEYLTEFKTILLSKNAPALEDFLTRAKTTRDQLL